MQNLKLLLLPLLFVLSHIASAVPVKILPLGDSITHGVGYNTLGNSSYRDELYDLLTNASYDFEFVGTQSSPYNGINIAHEGVGSIRADEILNGGVINTYVVDNLQTKLTNYNIDIVLLHAGTNDIIQGNGNNSTTLADIENIIDELQAKNSNVIVLVAKIIPILNPDISTGLNNLLTNSWAQSQSTSNSNIIIVDQHSGITSTDLYSDLVHPIQSGETKMAQKWFDTLILQDSLADQLRSEPNLSLSAPGSFIEEATFTISASSDSSSTITYSSATNNICSVINTTVTTLSAGTCTISGEQDANANYTSGSNSINITILPKTDQTITLNTPNSIVNVGSAFNVSASSTSGLTSFAYSTTTPSICSLSNNSVTALSSGNCMLIATQLGNANYSSSTSPIKLITIIKNDQTVTLSTPNTAKLGTSFTVNAMASSSLNVEIFSETPEICTIAEGMAEPIAAGTCTITAKQSGNKTFKPQTAVKTILISEAGSSGGTVSPLSLLLLVLISVAIRRRTSV